MTTVGEFDTMVNDMYQAGYVLISLDDLVTEDDECRRNGPYEEYLIYLPSDKKPLIMSEDDLSYYHSYGENGAQGYADKLVIDSDGK